MFGCCSSFLVACSQPVARCRVDVERKRFDFNNNSKLIFSVIKQVGTVGATNYDKPVLYERYEYGSLSAQSALTTRNITPACRRRRGEAGRFWA